MNSCRLKNIDKLKHSDYRAEARVLASGLASAGQTLRIACYRCQAIQTLRLGAFGSLGADENGGINCNNKNKITTFKK